MRFIAGERSEAEKTNSGEAVRTRTGVVHELFGAGNELIAVGAIRVDADVIGVTE